MAKGNSAEPSAGPTAEPSARSPLRLLIVDDDAAVARLFETIARQQGFESRCVMTGRAALELAAESDIVLLDQQLPDLSGLDVLEALRARAAAPAVVLVTGHGNETIAAAALRHGADDYVVKDAALPARLPQVLERVRRLRALRDALAAAERDLVRAERLGAIGEMAVTLHHELNNPLMAATAELQMLLDGPDPLTAAQRAGLEGLRGALARITDIVRRSRELRQARTVPYLAGVPMIDLAADATRDEGPAPPPRGAAVLYVPEEHLARVAALLLRHSGFRVQRVHTADELCRWAGALGVSLVLVAAETAAAGGDPLGGLRPEPDRRYTLVALAADDGGAARAAGADHVIALPFDPATFTTELLEAMRA